MDKEREAYRLSRGRELEMLNEWQAPQEVKTEVAKVTESADYFKPVDRGVVPNLTRTVGSCWQGL